MTALIGGVCIVGVCMISEFLAGLAEMLSLNSIGSIDIARGAIAGSLIAAIAFLSGAMIFRRSVLSICALISVVAAAALELSWLGFLGGTSTGFQALALGAFAAAAIVFLSASIGVARHNRVISGIMFTAAALIVSISVLSIIGRMDAGPAIRMVIVGLGAGAVTLSLWQSMRGDQGALLITPGVLLIAAAPLLAPMTAVGAQGFSILPHAMFTIGVLAASFVVIVEAPRVVRQLHTPVSADDNAQAFVPVHRHGHKHYGADDGSALLRVLNNTGVGVLDWSPSATQQSESLCSMLGADCNAPFTPDALLAFIDDADKSKFTDAVFGDSDGEFNVSAALFDGRMMRFRGARAATSNGINRLVMFVEPTTESDVVAAALPLNVSADEAGARNVGSDAAIKLAQALDGGDISAAFQPIVSLKDRKTIVGYEALARWRDAGNEFEDQPEAFVRLADSIGKGDQLTQIMLQQSAAYLSTQLSERKKSKLFVAMNVSWAQMREPAFIQSIGEIVKKYGLPKGALVLELTEGDALTDDEEAGRVFSSLKADGVALAFDDFGAGFSCLSNVRKFDFDYLKIDKSFADDLLENKDGAKIVGALAGLGTDLGLQVIVEGIEDMESANAAAKLGCAMGQGYAFGKPVIR